jgi:hypothetical protein
MVRLELEVHTVCVRLTPPHNTTTTTTLSNSSSSGGGGIAIHEAAAAQLPWQASSWLQQASMIHSGG